MMRELIERLQEKCGVDKKVAAMEKSLQRKFPKRELKFVKDKPISKGDLPSWSVRYRGYEDDTGIEVSCEGDSMRVAFSDDGRTKQHSGRTPKEVEKLIAGHFSE